MAKVILEAFCMKTKQKEKMVDPIISKTAKGGYIAKGPSKEGYNMVLLMSKDNAEAAVKSGVKKEGW